MQAQPITNIASVTLLVAAGFMLWSLFTGRVLFTRRRVKTRDWRLAFGMILFAAGHVMGRVANELMEPSRLQGMLIICSSLLSMFAAVFILVTVSRRFPTGEPERTQAEPRRVVSTDEK